MAISELYLVPRYVAYLQYTMLKVFDRILIFYHSSLAIFLCAIWRAWSGLDGTTVVLSLGLATGGGLF